MLATTDHGEAGGTPLLIAHGLFGSARNFGSISENLSDVRPVTAVDMRNHGESPWFDTHSYHDLAEDLAEVICARGGRAHVLGHSMGGKAAMVLALTRPEMVESLIVADIAPVAYEHTQLDYLRAMKGADLSDVTRRSEVDTQLREAVPEYAVRAFLLSSLDVRKKRWELNLDTLEREMDAIMDFPDIAATYDGPTMFLTGGSSDYVTNDHSDVIKTLFPRARFVGLPGTHHWLHAEKPREFEATVRMFLDAIGG